MLSASLAPGVEHVAEVVKVAQVGFRGAHGPKILKHVEELFTNSLNIVILVKAEIYLHPLVEGSALKTFGRGTDLVRSNSKARSIPFNTRVIGPFAAASMASTSWCFFYCVQTSQGVRACVPCEPASQAHKDHVWAGTHANTANKTTSALPALFAYTPPSTCNLNVRVFVAGKCNLGIWTGKDEKAGCSRETLRLGNCTQTSRPNHHHAHRLTTSLWCQGLRTARAGALDLLSARCARPAPQLGHTELRA